MVTEGKQQPKTKSAQSEADIISKFNRLKKSMKNCSTEIQNLKKRLFVVTKEIRALKKDRESHLKKIKRAERIDRKLEAEKSKLKRKVLKTETLKKVTLPKENANQTV